MALVSLCGRWNLGIQMGDMIFTSLQRSKGYGKALLSALAREVAGAEGVKGKWSTAMVDVEMKQAEYPPFLV
jgi:hypothetical protein